METASVVLIITLLTAAPDKPNIEHRMKEPTLDQCLADSKEFLASHPPKIDGVSGMMASCAIPITGSDT